MMESVIKSYEEVLTKFGVKIKKFRPFEIGIKEELIDFILLTESDWCGSRYLVEKFVSSYLSLKTDTPQYHFSVLLSRRRVNIFGKKGDRPEHHHKYHSKKRLRQLGYYINWETKSIAKLQKEKE